MSATDVVLLVAGVGERAEQRRYPAKVQLWAAMQSTQVSLSLLAVQAVLRFFLGGSSGIEGYG
jgi:hypothetical protein